jgi:hypothetical protein
VFYFLKIYLAVRFICSFIRLIVLLKIANFYLFNILTILFYNFILKLLILGYIFYSLINDLILGIVFPKQNPEFLSSYRYLVFKLYL